MAGRAVPPSLPITVLNAATITATAVVTPHSSPNEKKAVVAVVPAVVVVDVVVKVSHQVPLASDQSVGVHQLHRDDRAATAATTPGDSRPIEVLRREAGGMAGPLSSPPSRVVVVVSVAA